MIRHNTESITPRRDRLHLVCLIMSKEKYTVTQGCTCGFWSCGHCTCGLTQVSFIKWNMSTNKSTVVYLRNRNRQWKHFLQFILVPSKRVTGQLKRRWNTHLWIRASLSFIDDHPQRRELSLEGGWDSNPPPTDTLQPGGGVKLRNAALLDPPPDKWCSSVVGGN